MTRPDTTLGVRPVAGGIEAAVFAPDAEAIVLCLFDGQDHEVARLRLPHRVGPVFHGRFDGIAAGTRYGLRAFGPWDPQAGQRFNPAKLLFDPWATAIDRPFRLHPLLFDVDAPRPDDTASLMPKGVVGTPVSRQPEGPVFGWDRQVIYELHVRGFTACHPDIPPDIRGTYAALAHPAAIAHLVRLGVSTVEIMPSAAWIDERHLPPLGLSNYWGYNPVGFLCPDPRLAPGGWTEVRLAVDALHAAGINVLLDVVLNHSGESDEQGATLSLRGLSNAAYYRLRADDPTLYENDAGCGNVLAMDQEGPLRLGLDALRAWTLYGGFDGFRLDLAATLGRRRGGFDKLAPFLLAVEQDPVLSRVAMIAEPWDIGADGYQLGNFPARWGEWNDRYRDDVRRFWQAGSAGSLGPLTTRLAGSADVFGQRPLTRGINYVTAHDGFTMADLVAYARKQNAGNGEDNRDGTDDNLSWNNGAEGATNDPAIRADRTRDIRALLGTLLLSHGTPMLSMGDELGRTQGGNNNAYAQDNAASWIDWAGADQVMIGFTAELIALRRRLAPFLGDAVLTGRPTEGEVWPDVAWHRTDGEPMTAADWPNLRTLLAVMAAEGRRIVLAVHGGADPTRMVPPPARSGHAWRMVWCSGSGITDPLCSPAEPQAPASAGLGAIQPDDLDTVDQGVTLPARSVAVLEEIAAPSRTVRPKGMSDDDLGRLAQRAGIDPVWWDVEGGRHVVSAETQRVLLAAMRLPAVTQADFIESLGRLELEQRAPLPPVLTARIGRAIPVPLGHPHPHWVLLLQEDGDRRRFPVTDDGLTLPPLPAGRHRLLADDRAEPVCHLIVAPQACYLPPDLQAGERRFGIAAHLYTLCRAGDQGIGDFTTLALLAKEAAQAGAVTVGLNPLHALFPHDRGRISPYHPSDRRFLDPIYIDVSDLPGGQELPVKPGSVDYPGVWARKRDVLRRAVTPVDPMPASLRRFATFTAIADVLGTSDWRGWPASLRHPDGPGVAQFAADHPDAVQFHAFAQVLAERQLAAAAASARDDGLSLGFYRDLAVGAAPDGAEAWAAQDTLMTGVSVGSPPDPFSAQGQVWALPPPDPIAMRRDGYAAFDELLVANMRHAGALRIDHVMGLRRLFIVPDGAQATEGAYVGYPLNDLMAVTALRSQQAHCVVVGEDLGTVPEGMADALSANNILSYSVLWFERQDGRPRPPAAWRRLAAACVSTHDLPTLAGWWEGEDIAEKAALHLIGPDSAIAARAARQDEKRQLINVLADAALLPAATAPDGLAGPLSMEVAAAIYAFVAATPALLALVQAEDLAGERGAINLPGTDRERPNWQHRLAPDTSELLQSPLARKIVQALQARRP